jgi:2-succinyl-6-hydroxy-2,4-cyclohexadiene-1-carboxylate synthase
MTASAPLVTLHGFTGCAADLAPLAPTARLSLIGHSPELPVPPGHDFAAEVARVAAAIAALGQPVRGPRGEPLRGGVHLCGYSMGARVALAVALAAPRAIARLTLIGAHPGLAEDDDDGRAARRAADARWSAILREDGVAAFVAAWEAAPMWASQAHAPAAALARQRAVRLGHDPRQLAAALDALGLAAQPDLLPRLDRLATPTTFVAGALDDRFAALARQMAARVPGATVALVAGAGHNPLIDQPATLVDIVRGEAA